MLDERVAVKLGAREWIAIAIAAITTVGAMYQMRTEVLTAVSMNTAQLVAIKERLSEYVAGQSVHDEQQDQRTLRIEERQLDVRERLRSVEDTLEKHK